MRIVVAPDSYKGSASALAVAQAMERGIHQVFPAAEVCKTPIADGGEGTVEALVTATGGQFRQTQVAGPLGDPITARWGILGDGKTAVIEMAAASGLPLLTPEQRDPRLTTTFGTGELLRAALDAGLRNIILGIGGSATNDAGAGLAQALGARFTGEDGAELPRGGAALVCLKQIHLESLDPRLRETEITVACDVDNPLCGPRGASAVFGPQKGATPEMVAELDAALAHFAALATSATGRPVADQPGAGAAGGLGAAMLFFTPARLRPGVDIVLEAVRFADVVKDAAFVITGEGRTDFQTAFGKAPVGVARVAKQFDVPVFCLSGALGDGTDTLVNHGIDALLSLCDKPMTLEEAMSAGECLIEAAAARLCRIIKVAGSRRWSF
ncbi:MAG: glycerate kinase [Candidatus Competibacter sp.]|nr:glycerate kinase [Candidatus Competibacter sp.]